MSFGLSAVTNTGLMSLHTSSATEIRTAIGEARKDGATDIALTRDGKMISEADLARLTAIVTSGSTLTRYA